MEDKDYTATVPDDDDPLTVMRDETVRAIRNYVQVIIDTVADLAVAHPKQIQCASIVRAAENIGELTKRRLCI